MKEEFESSGVFSQNIIEFVTVASEYCIFVENTQRFNKKDFLDKARKILPLLYLKGSLIPKPDSIIEDENEKFVSEDDWDFVQSSVQKKLGYHDEYRDVFDPLTHEQLEQSVANVSDNMADIYQDLKNFISLYSIGNEELMNDALWVCQFSFEEFWGQKLLSALKAIHEVFFGDEDLDDEESSESNTQQDIDTSNWIISKRQEDYRKKE